MAQKSTYNVRRGNLLFEEYGQDTAQTLAYKTLIIKEVEQINDERFLRALYIRMKSLKNTFKIK